MVFDPGTPIYLQIMDAIRRKILSGQWEKGGKVTAVRELALQMEVNPNTMQKALSLLEEEGLLRSERTSGRFVTTDEAVLAAAKAAITAAEVARFTNAMLAIGYTAAELGGLFNTMGEEG